MYRREGSADGIRRVAELQQANAQLEQAIYALVHDLREPLRQIGTQAGFLRRRFEPALDDETSAMFEAVKAGVHRMRRMIDATLDLGARTHEPANVIAVDTRAVVNTVLKNFPVQETTATIHVGVLPVVAANREHVLHIFQNLLGNAIKYRSEKPPEIEIDAERLSGVWVFSVRDNGIGIDGDEHERIFEMFRRGRNNSVREGNGLGLATCKSIVERYNGRIWVESAAGRGSTFFFTLPAVPADIAEKKTARSECSPRRCPAPGHALQ